MTESERIDMAIANLKYKLRKGFEAEAEIAAAPLLFGLRGFPGKAFTISKDESFVSGGVLQLYVFTDDGKPFCKGTYEELQAEVIAAPEVTNGND